jgi:hypothetical protein
VAARELGKGIRVVAGTIHVGADGWAAHAGTQRVRSIGDPFTSARVLKWFCAPTQHNQQLRLSAPLARCLGSSRRHATGACCRRGEIEQHRCRSAARKGGVLAGLSRGNGGPVGLRHWAGRRPRRPPLREGRQPRCPPSWLAGLEGGHDAGLRSAEGNTGRRPRQLPSPQTGVLEANCPSR